MTARRAGCGSQPPDGSRTARPCRRAKSAHYDHGARCRGTPRRRRSRAWSCTGQMPSCGPGIRQCFRHVLASRIRCLISSRSHLDFDDAYAWIGRAIGRRRTTADRIRLAMDTPQEDALARRESRRHSASADEGALSVLEYRYVRRVERPHGLPLARRQARIRQRTGNRYLDNLYEEYGVCVELDGTAAHPEDEQWRDKRRDNANPVQRHRHVQVRLPRTGRSPMRERHIRRRASCARTAGWHSPTLARAQTVRLGQEFHDRGQFRLLFGLFWPRS